MSLDITSYRVIKTERVNYDESSRTQPITIYDPTTYAHKLEMSLQDARQIHAQLTEVLNAVDSKKKK